MPRIYDSASNPHDFCEDCFPTPGEADEEFGDVGDGPDGRGNCYGYDTEHPPYNTGLDIPYKCEHCGRPLDLRDD